MKRNVKPSSIIAKSNFEKYLNPGIKSMIKEHGLSPEDLRLLYFGDLSKLSEDGSSIEEDKIFERLIDYITDLYYHLGTHKVIRTQVEKSSAATYFYQYTYDKTPSPLKSYLHTKVKGKKTTKFIYGVSDFENNRNIAQVRVTWMKCNICFV